MSTPPGLRRSVTVLLAGGAAAQAVPLLLGPWLTRLYAPETFGLYHLFAAVAANVAVLACGRYEFALPVARDDGEARALGALARRILAVVTGLSTLGAVAWALVLEAGWPLWLPLAVATLGLLSLAAMQATRAQAFGRLAAARVLQHGGGAAAQVAAGVLSASVHGLIVGPVLAAAAAFATLGPRGTVPGGRAPQDWRAAARRHRDFPLLNSPHAFLGALQDTLSVALVAAQLGPAAAGAWGLALRYLKAPATLVGGAVSQALYPRLAQAASRHEGRALVRRLLVLLLLAAAPLVLLLWWTGPGIFAWAFGADWRPAGELASALAVYIGLHFVASPLSVVTLAWDAQAWALKFALLGQVAFVAALAGGLAWNGLNGAGWALSAVMSLYFGAFFLRLWFWPTEPLR